MRESQDKSRSAAETAAADGGMILDNSSAKNEAACHASAAYAAQQAKQEPAGVSHLRSPNK